MDTSKYQKRFSEARNKWTVFQLRPYMVLAEFGSEADADSYMKRRYERLQRHVDGFYNDLLSKNGC